MTHVKPEDLESALRQLESPPPGNASKVSDRQADDDAQSFMAFAGAMGIAPPKSL